MSYKKLGDIVKFISNKNVDGIATILYGINIDKYFMPSVANTIGVDLKKYKVVVKNQFACNRMHVGRDKRLPISMSTFDYPFIVSPAYDVFEVTDENVIPEYLMLWFRRSEFDRQCWFYTDADVRGGLSLDALKSIEIRIPSIEKQREIVAQYQAVANKIKVNEQICEKLEATAQTLYKQWFVDFEFPCLPSGYRPHGQVNQNLPIDEYITKIGSVCTYSRVGGLPVSDGKTWFVYLILCENDAVYKGITNDLYRRFYEHYMGEGAEWTKLNKPLKVIHWESFATKEEAAKREKDLKTGYGRTWISRQIEKAGGITQLKTSLPAPQTELRTAGKMVYNQELEKEIPEGWEVKELGNFIQSFSKSHDFKKKQLIFFNTSDILNGEFLHSEYMNVDEMPGQAKKSIKKDDILYSEIRPNNRRFALVRNDADDHVVSTKLMVLRRLNNELGLYRIYYYLISDETIKDFQDSAEGRSGTFPQITFDEDLKFRKIIIGSKEIEDKMENIFKNCFYQVYNLKDQNKQLAQLQSLLLSRLATLEG
ncbi:restriction endonuclease subunit S [Empedobacter stercoris]|uniref:restriction endonuclease subunit S n=1 Tax=Empedobacter stercoris TaxID=1628248 RepID=UPI0039ECD6AF